MPCPSQTSGFNVPNYVRRTLFFQQDNHPIHTANRIQRWFTRRRDVDPVDWPPNSPDMNPIQNLWAAVKRILRSNWAEQPPVRTSEELWDRVLDAWEEMAKNLDLFHNLVDSMPRRMRAVVDAGEDITRTSPYFYLDATGHAVTVNSESCVKMIENSLQPQLEVDALKNLWFQQDDVTTHTARKSISFPHGMFGGRLFLWLAHVAWPARSPDLS
ncbi:hypothetical protein ANN_01191 [Periplaneta americana]|uniref:Tc1-like transposase DDE domain-containing protein n=1 Tax=Periplaneta americana TaxID=6978 RepID=A0ABQ8TSX1_PERAM|nr:hypothetical protein ANN_01191 [Periplaneta americana]